MARKVIAPVEFMTTRDRRPDARHARQQVLVLRYQISGFTDQPALAELLELLKNFLYTTARSLAKHHQLTGLAPVEDLVSEGIIGIIDAAKRFQPQPDRTFLNYAYWYILAQMQSWLAENVRSVRVPMNVYRGSPRKEIDPASHSGANLIARLGRVEDMRLDEPVSHQRTDTHAERIASDEPTPEAEALRGADRMLIERAIGILNIRETIVVRGIMEGRTLTEIGTRIIGRNGGQGITKQRVKQIAEEAFVKLRPILRPLGSDGRGPKKPGIE